MVIGIYLPGTRGISLVGKCPYFRRSPISEGQKPSDSHPPASRDTSLLGRCPLCPVGRTQLPLSQKNKLTASSRRFWQVYDWGNLNGCGGSVRRHNVIEKWFCWVSKKPMTLAELLSLKYSLLHRCNHFEQISNLHWEDAFWKWGKENFSLVLGWIWEPKKKLPKEPNFTIRLTVLT